MKHLYYWNEQDEQWEHSSVCWCKIDMMDDMTQNDIRRIMGNIDSQNDGTAWYRWFEKDVETFQIKTGYRVKATATISVDTETRCKATSKQAAIDIARDLTNDTHGDRLLRWIVDSVKEMD